MLSTWIVIPCYNEAARFREADFEPLVERLGVHLLFVNDGSLDATGRVLEEFAAKFSGKCEVLALEKNSGKGEAVRRGLLQAIARDAEAIGYLDADGATPAGEMLRLLDVLAGDSNLQAVTGARVAMMGRSIKRRAARHYAGRVFATLASLALGVAFYDTQCGAKIFRVSAGLRETLDKPFASGWGFDVELLARLMYPRSGERLAANCVREVPLEAWEDKAGSKLGATALLGVLHSLVAVRERQRRRRSDIQTSLF